MKTILQRISEETIGKERGKRKKIKTEIANPSTPNDRRNFLKRVALGGIALGGLMHLSIENTIALTTQKVPLDSPGLGIEPNDEVVKHMLRKGSVYFDATPEWDSYGPSYDKLWT